MNVYTIRDRVAEVSSPPFTAKNDAVAKRMLAMSLADSYEPRDYELLWIATFNESDSSIESLSAPIHVCYGEAVVDSPSYDSRRPDVKKEVSK